MSDVNNRQPAEAQELSEILQVRRDKLSSLQQEGRDPFQQTKFLRTAWSVEIKSDFAGFENKRYKIKSVPNSSTNWYYIQKYNSEADE